MKDTTGGNGGEIVQVQGGHIIRSTARKDRHSKVYTAKGPRDRRVRLAAHTAIQFYDVQDRLGYDRPSKAVDWLMSKAKDAIDKLNESQPSPLYSNNPSSNEDPSPAGTYEPIQQDIGTNTTSFMQPDPHFVNTIKSFFPTSSLNLPDDFTSDEQRRSGTSSFDLGLSLHTYNGNSNMSNFQENFQRIDWNGNGNGNGNGENHNHMDSDRVNGFMMNSHEMAQDAVFTQGFPFTHRELLQSNSVVDAWNHERQLGYSESARNSSNFGSFFELGFSVPPRIYGEDEPNTHN